MPISTARKSHYVHKYECISDSFVQVVQVPFQSKRNIRFLYTRHISIMVNNIILFYSIFINRYSMLKKCCHRQEINAYWLCFLTSTVPLRWTLVTFACYLIVNFGFITGSYECSFAVMVRSAIHVGWYCSKDLFRFNAWIKNLTEMYRWKIIQIWDVGVYCTQNDGIQSITSIANSHNHVRSQIQIEAGT